LVLNSGNIDRERVFFVAIPNEFPVAQQRANLGHSRISGDLAQIDA
jgi:hypothetical protein